MEALDQAAPIPTPRAHSASVTTTGPAPTLTTSLLRDVKRAPLPDSTATESSTPVEYFHAPAPATKQFWNVTADPIAVQGSASQRSFLAVFIVFCVVMMALPWAAWHWVGDAPCRNKKKKKVASHRRWVPSKKSERAGSRGVELATLNRRG